MRHNFRFWFFYLFLLCSFLWAFEVRIDVRETAGIVRHLEPVTLSGAELLDMLQAEEGIIETGSIRLEDANGKPVPLQIDERDNGIAFLKAPNGRLDGNDELCWQVSLNPGESHEYRLRVNADIIDDRPFKSDLKVETFVVRGSSRVKLENGQISATVQGWPETDDSDKPRHCGSIILLEIYGVQQAQGSKSINSGNLYDSLYNRMEVITTGPVRAIVQLRGDPFAGRVSETGRETFWGRSFYDVSEGDLVRQYILYNDIPLLECRERLHGRDVHPSLTAAISFVWQAGGAPFDPETRFYAPGATETGNSMLREYKVMLPGAEPRFDVFTVREKEYGNRFAFPVALGPSPVETWISAVPSTGQPFPLFLFAPDRISRLHSAVIEPWMEEHYVNKGFDQAKSLIEIDFFVPDANVQSGGEWSWWLWGTRETAPDILRQVYKANIEKPLTQSLRIAVEDNGINPEAILDSMALPPKAMEQLDSARKAVDADFENFERISKQAGDSESEWIVTIHSALQSRRLEIENLRQRLSEDFSALSFESRANLVRDFEYWDVQTLPQELWSQQFELFREGHMESGYALLVTDNISKVFRTLRTPANVTTNIEWKLARRESESAQLIVIPAFRSLANIRLEAGDLSGVKGDFIPASAWRFHEILDVAAPEHLNAQYGLPEGTRWPDPLFPLESVPAVPADRLLPLLATLNVPAETPAGTYRGELRVRIDNAPDTTIPVVVRVFGFSIPEKRTLLWDSWFDQDLLVRYYEQGNKGATEFVTLDNFKTNMEMLARYRAVPGLYGWSNMQRFDWIKIWREADGRLTFDFTGINPWIEATQRHGNFWNPNLSCGSGWRNIFQFGSRIGKNMRNLVRDRQTGEILTIEDFPERSEVEPFFSRIYEQFMQAWVENLREHGWLETAWHEGWDEPTGARAEAAQRGHAYLRKIVPDLKLFNYGMRPVTDEWGWGLVDAWAPNLNAWRREFSGIEQARREGIRVFGYTCGASRHPMPDRRFMSPDINIWDDNIQRRVYGWMAYALKLDHLYIFMMNNWPATNREMAASLETRWPNSDWVPPDVFRPHTFWLVWPGPDGLMLPSLRLDALRDGFEDYEFLHAAERLYQSRPSSELKALIDVDDLIRRVDWYADDIKTYTDRKSALGSYIEKHGRE